MNRFIRHLAFFSIVFFVFDKLFVFVRNQSPAREADKRLELVLQGNMNKDIIILGSSRGARDILAAQIEDSTGYSSYNLSYPGSDVEFHAFLLETILEFNKAPKSILLAVDDPAQLLEDQTIKFRLDRLYPLVKYPYVRDELIDRGEKNGILDKIFILHQLNEANFVFTNKKFSSLDSLTSHGSMPISFQRSNVDWEYVDADTAYHKDNELPEKTHAFNRIVTLCAKHSIDLVLVIPPNYRTLNSAFLDRMQALAGGRVGVMAYNDMRAEFRDKTYYYDPSHLQQDGAEIFTDDLIAYLKTRWMQHATE